MVCGLEILAHADGKRCRHSGMRARRIERQLAGAPGIAENLRSMGAQMQVIGKRPGSVSDLPGYREMKGSRSRESRR